MGVAQEHGHAWGPLRGTRGSCHALILLLSLTQVLIHMIYMIARPQRQPHLSKNRQPRVLARIQPQLICIPSYSCIASTSSARKGSRTSSARPPSACHKPSALSACPAPSAPSRCPAPSSTPARSAPSSKGRCLDANLQPPRPLPSPLPWVHTNGSPILEARPCWITSFLRTGEARHKNGTQHTTSQYYTTL